MIHTRFGKLALGLVAVLALGLMSLGSGVAAFGDFDGGLAVFADKGGNGNGNGQDKDKDKDEDASDNGNVNGNGNESEEGGASDSGGQDQSDDEANGNGNGQGGDASDDDDGNGNGNGQGNGNGGDDEDTDDPVTDDPVDEGTPSDNGGNDKVGICHTTGSGSNSEVFISVSENAVPAHEAHGDEIDVASADDCGDGDATPSPDPGDGTPDPGDGTPEATPEIVF